MYIRELKGLLLDEKKKKLREEKDRGGTCRQCWVLLEVESSLHLHLGLKA